MSIEIKNLPNLSLFPQFEYEKYEGKATYQGKTCYVVTGRIPSTRLERVVFAIKALALTILSCGVALFFSQVRELWKNAFFATRQIKVYGNEEQLSESVKLAIYNSWNTNDSKPMSWNTTLTKENALKLLEDEVIDFEELPLHLKHDSSFVLEFCQQKDSNFWYIFLMPTSNPLLNNEDFILELIKLGSVFILKASKELINNEKFLSKAIQAQSGVKKCISLPPFYANNRTSIEEWMSARVDTFNYIPEGLKQDAAFIKKLREANPVLDEYLTCQDSGFNNEEKLLSLIKQDPTVIHLLPESIRSNRSFLIKMVINNVSCFQFLPLHLKHDLNFVLEVIKNLTRRFLEFQSLLALENNPLYFNPEVTEKIINRSQTLSTLPYQLRNNRDFLLKILDIHQLTKDLCGPLPKKFANDEEIILKWIKSGVTDEDLRRIAPTLKQNPQFIEKATAGHPDFSSCLKREIVRNGNEDQVLELIEQDPRLIHLISPERKANKEFLVQCVKKNLDVLHSIPEELLDETFILSLFEQIERLDYRYSCCISRLGLSVHPSEENVFKLIKLMENWQKEFSFTFESLVRQVAPMIMKSKRCFIQALNIEAFKYFIKMNIESSEENKPEWLKDRDVILALLSSGLKIDIPTPLQEDRDIIIAMLKLRMSVEVPPALEEDRDFVLTMLNNNIKVNVSATLQEDPELFLLLLKKFGVDSIPDKFLEDQVMMLKILQINNWHFRQLLDKNSQLLKNLDFLFKAYEINNSLMRYLYNLKNILTTNQEEIEKLKTLALVCIKSYPHVELPDNLKSDKDFWLKVAPEAYSTMGTWNLPQSMKNDEDVLLYILSNNPKRTDFVPQEMQTPAFKAKLQEIGITL